MRYGLSALFVCAATLLAGISPTATQPRLTASAMMMGGAGQILSIPPKTPEFMRGFVEDVDTKIVGPSGLCTGGDPGCAPVVVYFPAKVGFPPGPGTTDFDEAVEEGRANLDACLRGLDCRATSAPFTETKLQRFSDSSYVVEGISQSAVVASREKNHLIANPVSGRSVSFILVYNLNRPNGGLFERFAGAYVPGLGITFSGATPTNSPRSDPMPTIDIARQYDGWTDFPTNPANLLADLNAVFGIALVHNTPLATADPPLLQGYYQDSTYYLRPSPTLPLLLPLAAIPGIGRPLALSLDPPLRVLVEAGYDRTVNPGKPTPAQWRYRTDVAKTAANLLRAIPTGWDDAIAYTTKNSANRPFRTEPQGVYGVGGPPVYAGAVDAYGPVPAQAGPRADPPPASARAARRPGLPDRARAITARSRAGAAAASGPRRVAPHPVKMATARVQPADAA